MCMMLFSIAVPCSSMAPQQTQVRQTNTAAQPVRLILACQRSAMPHAPACFRHMLHKVPQLAPARHMHTVSSVLLAACVALSSASFSNRAASSGLFERSAFFLLSVALMARVYLSFCASSCIHSVACNHKAAHDLFAPPVVPTSDWHDPSHLRMPWHSIHQWPHPDPGCPASIMLVREVQKMA